MGHFDKLFKEKCNFEINMKCEDGKCFAKITGNNISLAAGLASLIEKLQESGFSKEEIEAAVKIGLKSKEEKEEEIKNKLNDIFDKLFK
jgi:hypothetical protein|nr:MAG TPA: UBA-like domain protein [Caudoviricetes sp.]